MSAYFFQRRLGRSIGAHLFPLYGTSFCCVCVAYLAMRLSEWFLRGIELWLWCCSLSLQQKLCVIATNTCMAAFACQCHDFRYDVGGSMMLEETGANYPRGSLERIIPKVVWREPSPKDI